VKSHRSRAPRGRPPSSALRSSPSSSACSRAPRAPPRVAAERARVVTDAHSRTTKDETLARSTDEAARAARGRKDDPRVPPRATAASKPLTVRLPARHPRPGGERLPVAREGSSELGWLVCPEANEHLANDTFSWAGTVADQRAVVARAGARGAGAGRGPRARQRARRFSQGAYVALDLVHGQLGRVSRPRPHRRGRRSLTRDARRVGRGRVVLAAGDLDGASGPMRRAAEHLRHEGADARFVSLGTSAIRTRPPKKRRFAMRSVWAGGSS